MPIFQKSIVDKYLETLDAGVLDKAYDSYKEVYSAQKIQRIKKLKEEQYQGGFLKDIFGSVLGYTIDPEVGYNIELEKKNETNSKKADGAIVQDEKVLGVIELKSNTTKNLESIKDQAFGYKNNHKGCKYVISSNFHKLRFYVDDATEYEEFDLYNLDKETFKKFYLYLRKEGLLDKNIPKLLKEETKFHEENISKQLYKDYSIFKNKFFENIVKNNPQYDKLLLFKKSQKFLDRILFVLFAEDKELIPTNAISKIVESWALAGEMHYKPLYELFTILFEHLNVGHIYKSGYEIPAYNGGLFAPDEVLDNLKVDDEILKDDLLTLSKYDFNTDVDVNILGHIFEHSLSEIEEIEAELKGEVADKSKGKRKKDGVFYTPKYITKYIVDNTVGKLCSEKKEVLGLDIDLDIQDYQKSNGAVNAKGKELFHTLDAYKKWLLSLKILDPACGSGAFLNQALTFLIEEHKNIDDLIAELTNTPLRIFDTDKAILENNIFGVDINDESVEIAKLSLWLRTAQKGRKLSNLNNNIKCGNSLINDPAVAGDKAFNWVEEFPEIFAKGGFDVVIGNPPYGASLNATQTAYFRKEYETVIGHSEVYYLFTELAQNKLIKQKGMVGYIIPNAWLSNKYAKALRNFLLQGTNIKTLINFNQKIIFEDANVETSIVIFCRDVPEDVCFVGQELDQLYEYNQNEWLLNQNQLMSFAPNKEVNEIVKKLNKSEFRLEQCLDISNGIKPYQAGYGLNLEGEPLTTQDVKNKIYHSMNQIDSYYKKEIKGKGVGRYKLTWEESYIKWGKWLMSPKSEHYFEQPKILIRQIISKYFFAVLDSDKYYSDQSLYMCTNHPGKYDCLEFYTGLLNSRLYGFYFRKFYSEEDDLFPKIKVNELKNLPIKNCSTTVKEEFKNKVLSLTKDISKNVLLINTFSNYLQSEFSIEKLPRKLEKWQVLESGEFLKELNKVIKKAGGGQLDDKRKFSLLSIFEEQKKETQKLKTEIDKKDKEIDQMVYELYGLTKEEIQIVENS
jgi:type I restriction-modification system DNA methylase subunit